MRKLSFVTVALSGFIALYHNSTPLYSISNIPLPAEMDKQVCISGMVYSQGALYFASERCPMIIAAEPATGKILNTYRMNVPQNFEMEGMTNFNGRLYLISENIAAIYEFDPASSAFRQVQTGEALPPKTKNGDGMEGIAGNAVNNRFYLLRERNDDMSFSQIYTCTVKNTEQGIALEREGMIQLPLENPQWRYSDISYDAENSRLLLLKSYSKGKMRQQFIETMEIDKDGKLVTESLKNVPVENFSTISNQYKNQDYSMNLEGITMDKEGNLYVVSDNTSGKAACDEPARERTILLMLKKNQPAKE
jgi:uncharacterized protein YjiK